uniref:Uncharacterized protein n=1 Tax=Rhizophora mucronata TaxID=61149 RepID=A0A2P2Q2K3_RHIMU
MPFYASKQTLVLLLKFSEGSNCLKLT